MTRYIPHSDPDYEMIELGTFYTSGYRFKATANRIAELSPKSVLNIGCEYGYLETIVSESISITSIDLLEENVIDASHRNRHLENREFHTMDLFDIPDAFGRGSFDCVVINEVVEHVPDDERAMNIAFDVLRPGGELILTVPNFLRFPNRVRRLLRSSPRMMAQIPGGHIREYLPDSALALVRNAGFECDSYEGVDFWLPLDRLIRPVIPVGSPLRRWAGHIWPAAATWFQLCCRKPE